MPLTITFCHADPQDRFRTKIEEVVEGGTDLDVAVAFMTKAGVDAYRRWATRIGPGNCRLCVSVHFPTNLDALCELSTILGDRLRIHLGSKTPREKVCKVSPLLHSKIVWASHGPEEVGVFVGSHNWTSTALDGANMEASVLVECETTDPFAVDVKAHLDACFTASTPFDPADLDFDKAVQADLYPSRPGLPDRAEIEEFVPHPAVVIHAEDRRSNDRPDRPDRLLLYLPLRSGMPSEWFNPTLPTAVYLYLYPPGRLLGFTPPSADPFLYGGAVTTFGRSGNPIFGQKVNSRIRDLTTPVLEDVSDDNIPSLEAGEVAQVVVELRPHKQVPLPVYLQDVSQPGVRVEVDYDQEGMQGAADVEPAAPLPRDIWQYYMNGSIREGRFVYQAPFPVRRATVHVPGIPLYRVPPQRTVQEVLGGRGVEVETREGETDYPYFYQVRFLFDPQHGTGPVS